MNNKEFIKNADPAYIEEMYKQYKANPNSVDSSWQYFFKGYDFAEQKPISESAIGPIVME